MYRGKGRRRRSADWGFESLEPRLAMAGVVINEFLALNTNGVQDQDGDRSDWIELRNTSAAAVDLTGWHLTDDASDLDRWDLPAVTLAPGAFLTVFASGKDRAVAGQELHANFSLEQNGEYLGLVMPDGNTIVQAFDPFPPQLANVSYGLGAAGASLDTLVDEIANVRVHVPTAATATDSTWMNVGFNDSSWLPGQTGVGYDRTQTVFDPYILLDVDALMPSAQNRDTIYIRVPFDSADVGALESLTLAMRYDDGFVAYLNGQEIARRNFTGTPLWNSQATSAVPSDAEAIVYQSIPVSQHLNKLVSGPNVLAIHGLNRSTSRSDFLISPKLTASRAVPPVEGFMVTPSFGATNQQGALGVVADTKFSVDRGFYNSPQSVLITTTTADAQIRYTVDGSVPTATAGLAYTSGTPIPIATTTTLRAAAFKTGWTPTNVDTQTYIFLDDVIQQDGSDVPPHQNWGHLGPDWEMDPEVVNNPLYAGTIKNDLQAVPTVSLVMPWETWFGAGGIYISGSTQERSGSVEFFTSDGSQEFQIDSALEIFGGTSDTRWNLDKLSIKATFKPPFGPTELNAEIFNEPEATTEFDSLIFDAVYNFSWAYGGNSSPDVQRDNAKFIQDQFVADLQQRMGGEAPHGRFVHLYLNGLYWGMYYLHERPDESFAAEYLGGDKDDYDVVKHTPTDVVAGDTTAIGNYAALLSAVRSNLSVPANYTAVQQKLDVDQFIDYMLVNYYAGNTDWSHHNWYATFNRVSPDGRWRFHSWDAEHVLKGLNDNLTNKIDGGTPTEIHHLLMANPEYKLRFADRVQKHFFNGGTLTPQVADATYLARMQEIDRAIVGESARWGDGEKTSPGPYTRDHWLVTQNNLRNNYFPSRTNIVLNQFIARGWLAATVAPAFGKYGGQVVQGYDLTITGSPGVPVYYTVDGSDPRAVGGAINGTLYTMPVDLPTGLTVKARAFDGANWSALVEATFIVAAPADASNLRISELHYNPAAHAGVLDPQDLEFIELLNPSNQPVSLDGVQITQFSNTPYEFGNGLTLAAGGRLVIAKNPAIFQSVYGAEIDMAPGGFTDASLSNGGERIAMLGSAGQVIQDFLFNDEGDWPAGADGGGSSLEIVDPLGDPSSGLNWRASFYAGGSPGAEGLPPAGTPGDFNDDDNVDGADFLTWQRGLGTTGSATRADGDADGDHDVDSIDLGLWNSNFGQAPSSAAASAVAGVSSNPQQVGENFLAPGEWIVADAFKPSTAATRRQARYQTVDQSLTDLYVSSWNDSPPVAVQSLPSVSGITLQRPAPSDYDVALEEELDDDLATDLAQRAI